jgi:hypothetical protein
MKMAAMASLWQQLVQRKAPLGAKVIFMVK